MHPGIAIARSAAKGHAAGCALRFQRLVHFKEGVGCVRELGEPSFGQHRFAVVLHICIVGDGQGDPFATAFAIGFRRCSPAAIFAAEVGANICHIETFCREQMGQGIKTPEQIWPLVGIGRNGSLGLHVVKGLVDHRDLDACGFGKGINQNDESVLFRLDKALPAEQLQRGTGFWFPAVGLRPGFRPFAHAGCAKCTHCAQSRSAFQH